MNFYVCNICGNIVEKVKDNGPEIVCCGVSMEELTPNTVEAATEKHIPVVTKMGDMMEIKVGEVEHPMIDAHYIEWILIDTASSVKRYHLEPNDEPKIVIPFEDNITVYAYCNIHGLWK